MARRSGSRGSGRVRLLRGASAFDADSDRFDDLLVACNGSRDHGLIAFAFGDHQPILIGGDRIYLIPCSTELSVGQAILIHGDDISFLH